MSYHDDNLWNGKDDYNDREVIEDEGETLIDEYQQADEGEREARFGHITTNND